MACCSREAPATNARDIDTIRAVHDAYSAKAAELHDAEYATRVASAFGYTPEQLRSIPAEANMGLSCGNPVAAASIQEGERVLDLGSGGGIDVLLATQKVGPNGQAIGLDMSENMIALARRNAAKQGFKPPQTAFVQARLTESLPIASNTIDCILSNCVVNLLPLQGKTALMKEVYRVLKPGGRVVLDDIIAKKPLPAALREDMAAWAACISGAVQLGEYKALLADAGFTESLFVDTHGDMNVYFQSENNGSVGACCPPSWPPKDGQGPSKPPLPDFDANSWVATYQIYARKSSEGAPSTASPLLRWQDAYPAPISTPEHISPAAVAALIRDKSKTKHDFAVIDVRRDDHAGGHVRGSHQWPAQTFYDDLDTFVNEFSGTKQMIFYCNSCKPGGRGPRCAAWYQDRLDEGDRSDSHAYVLEGGIKAWLSAYDNDEDLVEHD